MLDLTNVQAVLCATGYDNRRCAPVWLTPWAARPRLLRVFPLGSEPFLADPVPGLAFVGDVRPYLTSIPMLIEFQARWVAAVFSGRQVLEPLSQRRRTVAKDRRAQRREFPCHAGRLPGLVDPYDYVGRLAARTPTAHVPWGALLAAGEWGLLGCILLDTWNPCVHRLADASCERRALARRIILEHHTHPTSVRIRNQCLLVAFYAVLAVLGILIFLFLVYRCQRR